jgi:REP element-mobilizing transposase RayT
VRVRGRRGFLFTGYVFMPDHWQALIIPRDGDALPNLMDAFKVASTLGINRSRRAKGPAWQPRYFDHIVRNVGEYQKTMEYMHLNPVRRGLVVLPRIGCGQAFTLTAARVPSACRWTCSPCRPTKGPLCERGGTK